MGKNSAENVVEEDDDDEALSLSDLPLMHNSRIDNHEEERDAEIPLTAIGIQEDFDFCSFSKESDMCTADELFFQGQIVPFRHSVSSEKGLLLQYCGSGGGRCISRSESMDCSYSSGLISSRSSSISSSHQSSSSSSSAAAPPPPKHKKPPPPQNHFHSHPSPSPRVLNFNRRGGIITSSNNRNCAKKSSAVWKIFRLGLVTSPPEIGFHDLKTRCPNNKNFGSRNRNGGGGSLGKMEADKSKKMKKPISLFGGCNCSIDAVETANSRAVNIKRESEVIEAEEIENGEPVKLQKQQVAKKHMTSHHRTFEWLKQLSIEGPAPAAHES